jgi:hypothetical protein
VCPSGLGGDGCILRIVAGVECGLQGIFMMAGPMKCHLHGKENGKSKEQGSYNTTEQQVQNSFNR